MNKPVVLGALTFVAGLILFQLHAARLERELRGGEPVPLLVAARDLPVGATVAEGSFAVASVPSRYVDSRRALASDEVMLRGGRLALPLLTGQSVMRSDVETARGPERLALLLPPGRRAYQLGPSENPLGELLRAGDRVDVLALEGSRARTLLENIPVLAVGAALGEAARGAASPPAQRGGVTLDVTQTEAEALLVAQASGKLRLALRNPEDAALRAPDGAALGAQALGAGRERGTSRAEIEHVR
jgi:pilus assembly protein CpaB